MSSAFIYYIDIDIDRYIKDVKLNFLYFSNRKSQETEERNDSRGFKVVQ